MDEFYGAPFLSEEIHYGEMHKKRGFVK